MSPNERIQPVILSGGSGTRLWPLSRPDSPKQLLPLTDERTMLQLTVDRVTDGTMFQEPIIVCGARHAEAVEAQLAEAGAAARSIIVEPMARNTAPAIALAAATVDPETILLVMPSDHVVKDVATFLRTVQLALPVVIEGWLVTFGIEPDRPETGYGYIRRGPRLSEGVYQVDRFVEKPNVEKARAYLAEGDCSWNGGIFIFRAGDYLTALRDHAPEILDAVQRSLDEARAEGNRLYPEEAAFGSSPSISIDYAVLEKVGNAAVAPADMGWSDIGSWDALYDFLAKDEGGNIASGDVVTIASEGTMIRTSGPTVAAIGVSDLIILATPDAVLVLPRGESQRVKEIVESLEARKPS